MRKSEIRRIAPAPERIFLQVGDDPLEADLSAIDFHNDITWCWERIFNTDIEYVRIDRCKGAKPRERISDGQRPTNQVEDAGE